ncbi:MULTISPECIES: MATE family efflux transporter [Dyella]|uniref:MATE family efflux transporter n=2 Tax=Dyella TaxID=231454 RepID=A0A4V2NMI8_9GAMM|nr:MULTISPECIES: MATE family efflux transporter [Dyella]TBR38962.1 MATE family efflux transporter [Dyella terrae]TCI13447.1 MATE family efflux transporter [Dyella soli]
MSALVDAWHHRPTHRQVWALAVPMILSNLTVPLVALVDSAVAGHLPQTQDLGAVAIGSAVYALPVWSLGFLRMGTTGFAAQALGANDMTALRTVQWQALMLAVLFGLAVGALMYPLLPWLIAQMHSTPLQTTRSMDYLHLRLLGLPGALLNYALAGWFIGAQRARTTLSLLLVTNLINIALNLLFVLGLGWGVQGIALASVAGEWCGSLYGLWAARRAVHGLAGHVDWAALRQFSHWRPLLSVNRDIFIRTLALEAVFFSVSLLGARIGDSTVAANALLLNGLMLTAFGLDGLANAVEALCGHAIGARDPLALRRALVVAGGWSLIGSIGYALLFVFAGHEFVNLQTNLSEVREAAYPYLPWLAALPVVAVWSYLLDGLFIGATRGSDMRNAMLVSVIAFFFTAWLARGLGNHGLWMAFIAFMLVRGVSLGWASWKIHRRGAWTTASAVNF